MGDARLQHLQNQRTGCGITVLRKGSHLIRFTPQGVLVGHGKDLRVVQRLTQRNKPESRIVREFGRSQFPGVSDTFVVNALGQSEVHGRNGAVRASEFHDTRVVDHHVKQLVIRIRRILRIRNHQIRIVNQRTHWQVRRDVVLVLTQVRESDDVSNVLRIRLGIDDPHLNSRDVHSRRRNGQALHRRIVEVMKILGEEVVAIGFVIVSADVKLLGLRASLHFDFLPLAFLL